MATWVATFFTTTMPPDAPHTLSWTRPHLLSLADLSPHEIRLILDTAHGFGDAGRRSSNKLTDLRGKVVVNAFFEDSTRTRISFTLAAQRLGADVIDFAAGGSSLSKGESLVDTVRTIDAMGIDALIVRHAAAGAADLVAKNFSCPVINAGDGAHEHPTQALLDAYTIRQRLDRPDNDFTGLRVLIVGDIANSRVARSNVHCLTKLGAAVTVCGPATLCHGSFRNLGADVAHDFDSALPDADVVMMLRVQSERMKSAAFPSIREYVSLFGLRPDRLARCKPDVLILHPGPMNRGAEIDSGVADGPRSAILQQVSNGLAVRMAVLSLVTGANLRHS